jgi:hypothetical protein
MATPNVLHLNGYDPAQPSTYVARQTRILDSIENRQRSLVESLERLDQLLAAETDSDNDSVELARVRKAAIQLMENVRRIRTAIDQL